MPTKITTIKIDRLALEGDGIGRLTDANEDKGKVAFVSYTLPNETVKARCVQEKKNLSHWIPTDIVEPSPDRIEPKCGYHFKPGQEGPWCGGCSWQMISYEAQLKQKTHLLVETLERMGGQTNLPIRPAITTENPWRYRNKVQVPFALQSGRVVAGFYAPESHEIIEFNDCDVQTELSVELVKFVKEMAKTRNWQIYNEDRATGWLRHVLIRTNRKNEAMLVIVANNRYFQDAGFFTEQIRKNFPTVVSIFQNVQSRQTNVILGTDWIRLWGKDRIDEDMMGLKIQYSAGAFFQVNTDTAEKMFLKVCDLLNLNSSDLVADLYCGVGALTLAIAKRAGAVVGVEVADSAIRDAKNNARLNHIENAKFVTEDAERFLRSEDSNYMLMASSLKIVIDPPRAGCTPGVINSILHRKPNKIIYISCHPATLARDLKLLSPSYKLTSLTPVDLFPQTSHIESLAELDLK